MNPKISFLIFLSLLSLSKASGQKQANVWHFGDGRCLDFSSGAPVNVTGSQMWTIEGCASYCDEFGNLLFYTNGGGDEPQFPNDEGHIWNRNNAVMYNMQGLQGGGFSAKQSSVVVEAPGQDSVYYVFTMDQIDWNNGQTAATTAAQPNGRGFSYFTVDMRLNNGLGDVVQIDQRVYAPSAEGMCAVRHSNGRDFWIIINRDSTGFGVYSLTPSGVAFSSVYPAIVSRSIIKASPDGAFVVAAPLNPFQLQVFRFNNTTGVLSNPIGLPLPNFTWGWEFSPNSRYLFASQRVNPPSAVCDIKRFDLLAPSIPASVTTLGTLNQLAADMQLAPDGNIYLQTFEFLAPFTSYIHRISCPNTVASLQTNLFSYNNNIPVLGLPNFPAWLFDNDDATFVALGPDTVRICDVGGSMVLSAQNPGAAYLWSTGETTQTITVTAPGTYSVTVTGSCGTGSDEIVIVPCSSSSACDLIPSSDSLRICSGDTIQLQSNLSAYTNITGIQWTGGNGSFIPSDTVAAPRYVPSSSEISQGFVNLSIRLDAAAIDTSAPGRLIAYDHSGNDLIFAISPLNGSIDSIQDNLGIDWVALGFESTTSILYGLSAFSTFSSVNLSTGVPGPLNGLSGENFYAGEFDNVHGKFYAVGHIPSPSGNPVDQFLCTVNTSTGAYNIIGNLNLFTSGGFYYGDNDAINGLAYDPGQDVLYGVTFNGRLFRINVTTANATFVGNTTADLRGLAYDPVASKLWGITSDGTLHEINKNSGALIGTVSSQVPFSFVTSLTYARSASLVPITCYDTLFVQIAPIPAVSLVSPSDSCSRSTYPFNLNTNGLVNAVQWNFGDPGSGSSNSSSLQNPSHTFSAPGTYNVSVAVNLECLSDTLFRTVNVLPVPFVEASSAVNAINEGDSTLLNASGALNYLWSPSSGLSCSACPAPTASPAGTTTYFVTGTNAQGCSASDSVTIRVDINCNELFLADIFTPNSEGPSANEKLCVYGNCIRLMSLMIYNRWGEQVFETSDPANCWDGTFKGKDAAPGIYAYKLYVEQRNGNITDKKGTITLIR